MGSFNTSCFVSNQIIGPRAPAVILPIVKQATYNTVELTHKGKNYSTYGFAHTTCYATAFWSYAGPMFSGEYRDYGCFELFDTEENHINLINFFNMLLDTAFTTKQGKNPVHEIAFNIQKEYDPTQKYSFSELHDIWNTIWEVSQEHRLFIKEDGEPRSLNFAVMHQAAATYLINTVSSFKYRNQSLEQQSYFKHYFDENWERFSSHLQYSNELLNDFPIFSLHNFLVGTHEGAYISHHYDNNQDKLIELLRNYKNNNPGITNISEEVAQEIFKIFKTQLDHRYIQDGLNHFNIKLSPMIYASQDYDNTTGKSYKKMISAVSAMVNKQIKEDN